MTLSQEQFELIEAYLTNELSATDRASFEQDMTADPALAQEVDTQRNLRMGLQALAIEQRLQRTRQRMLTEQRKTTQSIDNKKDTLIKSLPVTTTKSVPWTRWAAAASVVIGLGLGMYVYQQQLPDLTYADTASVDQLTKSLPANLLPADRRRVTDAIKGYKSGQYDRVIEQLKIPSADRRTVYYQQYYLGLSYLAKKQPADAIAPLRASLGTLSVPLRQKANWFLALAYLKNKEKDKALPILETIRSDATHPYHELAGRVDDKVR